MKGPKIRREFVIGFIIIAILVAFLWGVSYIKSNTLFVRHAYFVAVYDKVNGLLPDNPVVINGIRVGKVKELGLLPYNNKVYVKVMLTKDVKIPDNSYMLVVSSDLLGAKSVEISLGDSKFFAKSGDTLKSKPSTSLQEEVNMQVLPLKKKAEELFSSFDTLITDVRAILNANTRDNLQRSFEGIHDAINSINITTSNLDTLIGGEKNRIRRIFNNLESITSNFKNNNDKLSGIINNFSLISDSLAKVNIAATIRNVDKTLDQVVKITDKINNGHGSLGLLINNDSLYNNLNSSSEQLRRLLQDMRLNPKRYVHLSVFGSKPSKYKPPDNKNE